MPSRSLAAVAVVGAFAVIDGAFAQQITRVTLYPGSATIERTAQVTAGAGKVELTGLPATFDPRTLRVDTDAGIQVGEVAVKDVSRTEALGAREAELEARIERLKDEKAALDVDVKTAELMRNYLASLSARPEGDKSPRPAFDPRALEAIRRGGADAYGTIQRTDIRKRELDKRIAALEGDLARIRNGARDVRTVAISYTATRPGALRAAYQVSNAGWRPKYRAALDSATSRVDLERQAAIMQRTGEDWRGVSLRLSTGAPRSAQVLDPGTWQLVIRAPMVEPLPGNRPALMSDSRADKIAAARAPASEPAQVAELQTEYATEFEVPGKVDLSADGRQITVSLAHQQIAVKQRIRVVPRRDSAALVTAEADLPEGVWIPGDVQLYRDGGYVGSTYWQAQAKERLVLPFGRDDRVQVAMKRLKDRKGAAGIISQRAEREVATLYTVTSRHKVPVELLLLESAPVPVDDKITVDTTFEPKPKTANWEERRGVYAWEQPLAPGQTLKFVADYTITYPKDAVIAGLP
ncbi:MAG TPA: DUF4139 domain-containing protein [Burkholderiales bacterium]|nr:DUF4139 domain-containing protein [Burkholderiales bacterium]